MPHLQSCGLEQLCGLWPCRSICSSWDARQSRVVPSRCPHIYRCEAALGLNSRWRKSIRGVLRIVGGMVARKPGTPSADAGKGRSRLVRDRLLFAEFRKLSKARVKYSGISRVRSGESDIPSPANRFTRKAGRLILRQNVPWQRRGQASDVAAQNGRWIYAHSSRLCPVLPQGVG